MGVKSGFVLVEVLFTIAISSLVSVGLLNSITNLKKVEKPNYDYHDIDLACKQLQQYLIKANHLEVSNQELSYQIESQPYKLSLNQHRLIKQDGFEILLFNVDEIDFEINDYCVIKIRRNEEWFSRIIKVMRVEEG